MSTNTAPATTPSVPNVEIVQILKRLVNHPDTFEPEHLRRCLHLFFQGEGSSAQIAALLVALRLTKVDQRPDMIAAAAETLLSYAVRLNIKPEHTWTRGVVDIVGTGGDGHNTFNVSTSSAIVAAGAGCKVAKHGNRSSTSNSGSADLLESLGCNLSGFPPESIIDFLKTGEFCFLYAPRFHPLMGRVAQVRKEIGAPSIFNIIGPLINPVVPTNIIVGVHSAYLGPIIAEALRLSGTSRGMVVCGVEGLDEISPQGDTLVWHIRDNQVEPGRIHPTTDFGLSCHSLETVKGHSGEANARYLDRILDGEITDSPILDFILLNTSALLVVSGVAETYVEGVQKARESIASKRAKRALAQFAEFTQAKH
ncbi:anthranilate phosphoribosyltransferase [Dimargaris cristalligena]|uniref:Anthranilate phosphoribosyltransferase n=1 Tax=Dimargaris cristalligena TaxID=215637 RepID=A0A4P9ZS04_9FUNG|nr:anthranilate phosphoribosyltransferase [Dimargaris cristalligena]RKP36175.1 glycosyl transferase family, a/b domain-containing protein [Dimargaris cristalligena]|eukprot:RKP36175.1 glycosyl transferase family, a/b domain-containing protein [Dimargaris cristalligena]